MDDSTGRRRVNRPRHKGKRLSGRAPTHTSDEIRTGRPVSAIEAEGVPRATAARGRAADHSRTTGCCTWSRSSATRPCRRRRSSRRHGRGSSTCSGRTGSTRSWRTGSGPGRRTAGPRSRLWRISTGSFSTRRRGRCGPAGNGIALEAAGEPEDAKGLRWQNPDLLIAIAAEVRRRRDGARAGPPRPASTGSPPGGDRYRPASAGPSRSPAGPRPWWRGWGRSLISKANAV